MIKRLFNRNYKKKPLRIVALMTVRNEELYLRRCLQHLHEQGVETCVIDNGSTDATYKIAEQFLDRGVCRLEKLPYHGVFELETILKNEERLSREINADWFIHYDADEIREAPEPYGTLHEGITDVDRQGYNAINFDEFVFLPHREDRSYEDTDYVQSMRHYYFFEPYELRRVNAWKKNGFIDLASKGGHSVEFKGKKVFPVNFINRHYITLSKEYALRKYGDRIFSEREVNDLKWHWPRTGFSPEKAILPDVHQLKTISQICEWDRSDTWKTHGFIGPDQTPIPFIVGVGRSGTTLLRLMLDSHPDMVIPPETHFIPNALKLNSTDKELRKKLLDVVLGAHTWGDFHIDPDDFRRSIESIEEFTVAKGLRVFYSLYADKHNKKRWGDKSPPYQIHMTRIQKCLPETHFIHIIRDGRDVAVSARKLWFGAGEDICDQANRWKERIIESRKQAKSIPYYMEVRYEDLIRDSEAVLKQISAFIQIPYSKLMLNYYQTAEQRLSEIGHRYAEDGEIRVHQRERLDIHKMVSKKPDESRIGHWKSELSSDEVVAYEKIAGSLLEDLGYKVSGGAR